MSLHDEQIDAIVSSSDAPTFDNVILAFDNSGKVLSRAWTVFGLLNAADTDEAMQAVAAEMSPRHHGTLRRRDDERRALRQGA